MGGQLHIHILACDEGAYGMGSIWYEGTFGMGSICYGVYRVWGPGGMGSIWYEGTYGMGSIWYEGTYGMGSIWYEGTYGMGSIWYEGPYGMGSMWNGVYIVWGPCGMGSIWYGVNSISTCPHVCSSIVCVNIKVKKLNQAQVNGRSNYQTGTCSYSHYEYTQTYCVGPRQTDIPLVGSNEMAC